MLAVTYHHTSWLQHEFLKVLESHHPPSVSPGSMEAERVALETVPIDAEMTHTTHTDVPASPVSPRCPCPHSRSLSIYHLVPRLPDPSPGWSPSIWYSFGEK